MPKQVVHSDAKLVSQLFEMFPDETVARLWFEDFRWNGSRFCGHCGGRHTTPVKSKRPMPYWCRSCRNYFSVKTGTVMDGSRIPFRKWAIALHLMATDPKGVSSMQLHRDLRITQKTAWYMAQKIRRVWKIKYLAKEGTVDLRVAHQSGLQ